MKKRNRKHENRVKKLIVGCGLCAVILTVSTYAWFIGMKTVNVEAFNVKIAAIDGLSLSLDGVAWSETVEINEDNYNLGKTEDEDGTYATNTNSWSDLVPMSSVGVIDTNASRLILYEKGSITDTDGGYRIMASRTRNTVADNGESRGYVAFDLFVKNLSGEEYYAELDEENEEAIFLTPQSEVTVGESGDVRAGIENSVRVGFAQIGRVTADGDADASDRVQPISCAAAEGVTPICSRNAVIWEPNDTSHVQNAINWFKSSCKNRNTGATNVFADGTYTDITCTAPALDEAVTTYAVSGVIDSANTVDTYDGLNGYTGTIVQDATPANNKLMAVDYFTDTEKMLEGNERPEIFTLAPNSITKVRIYIWLEGQDIDNYDFASLGGQIAVSFGFTKERYYGEDIDYDGPELPEDVVRNRDVSYAATGDVTAISNASVTYNAETDMFSIPKTLKEDFTFKDGADTKTATYVSDTDTWSFN